MIRSVKMAHLALFLRFMTNLKSRTAIGNRMRLVRSDPKEAPHHLQTQKNSQTQKHRLTHEQCFCPPNEPGQSLAKMVA